MSNSLSGIIPVRFTAACSAVGFSTGRSAVFTQDLRQSDWVALAVAAQWRGVAGIEPRHVAVGRQVHAARCVSVIPRQAGNSGITHVGDADALITLAPLAALCVFTADCLPIFFARTNGGGVGVAHAGWRGTEQRIAVNTVRRFCRYAGCAASAVLVFLGGCIRSCCYQVGIEFLRRFPASSFWQGDTVRFDLAAENIRQLTSAGVPAENIRDCRICTACSEPRLYSYRRGSGTRRILNTIMPMPRGAAEQLQKQAIDSCVNRERVGD